MAAMEIIKLENVSFQYPDMETYALKNVSLNVKEGQFVVVCGPSGCGKTTLLRLLKKELSPVGTRNGDILYAGNTLHDWDDRTLIEDIGFVSQHPDNQIVMEDVMQEIVFGMENLGYSNGDMRKRVAEMVHFFGMEHLLNKKTSQLSGGQKQMLNLLAVLLLRPKVLLLDEPTSQLDPVAAKDLIGMLERLNKEMGMTIIMTEHRLEELFAIADHVVMMDQGSMVYEGESREVIDAVYEQRDEVFMSYLPSVSRLYVEKEAQPSQKHIPLTVKESKEWMSMLPMIEDRLDTFVEQIEHLEKPMLSVQKAYFQYNKHAPMVLKNISLDVHEGEYVALIGGNGSGKTTLLHLCLGIIKAHRGSAKLAGKNVHALHGKALFERVAYVPQNPNTYFIQDTIEKEMNDVVKRHSLENGAEKINDMLELFGIAHLRGRHPYDCSGGELQRATLACMLLGNPEILFIDEPTKGLDPIAKENFANVLETLHEQGQTIVMVTHDIEFAAKHASRCAMMFDGQITADGTPDDLFRGNYFYTTSINRATRMSNQLEALTLEEALDVWDIHAPI